MHKLGANPSLLYGKDLIIAPDFSYLADLLFYSWLAAPEVCLWCVGLDEPLSQTPSTNLVQANDGLSIHEHNQDRTIST